MVSDKTPFLKSKGIVNTKIRLVVDSGVASQFPSVHFIILLHGRLSIIYVFIGIKYFLIKNHPKALPLSLLKAQACKLWCGVQVPLRPPQPLSTGPAAHGSHVLDSEAQAAR